jgi:hypothetical protein
VEVLKPYIRVNEKQNIARGCLLSSWSTRKWRPFVIQTFN